MKQLDRSILDNRMNCMSKYVLLSLIIVGCSSSPRYTTGTVSKSAKIKKKVKSSSSHSKSDNVKHKKVMTGISSFYAEDFHGKLTCNFKNVFFLTPKTCTLNSITLLFC